MSFRSLCSLSRKSRDGMTINSVMRVDAGFLQCFYKSLRNQHVGHVAGPVALEADFVFSLVGYLLLSGC